MKQIKELLEMLLLGLLADSPKHGYELKKNIRELIGHIYTLSDGMLYPLLKSLEEKGFLIKTIEPSRNLNRYVYAISEAGTSRLRALLTKPLRPPGDNEAFDFCFRFILFQHLTPWERIEILQSRLTALEDALPKLDERVEQGAGNHYHKEFLLRSKENIQDESAWLKEQLRNEKQLFIKDT